MDLSLYDKLKFPSGVTPNQILELKKKGNAELLHRIFRQDIIAFGWYYFPELIDISFGIPDFQKEIIDSLNRLGKEYSQLCIVAPRGFSKSTVISKLFSIHRTIYKIKRFIVLISENFDIANSYLEFIKKEFETNQMLHQDFGTLRIATNRQVSQKWKTGDIITSNGVSLSARGFGQRIRGMTSLGFRPDLIIIDDPESKNNTVTKEQMIKNLRKTLNAEILPAIKVAGKVIGDVVITGNYIKPGCMVHKISRNPEWKRIMFSALDKNGKSIWEDKIPTAYLEAKRTSFEAVGDYETFWLEYQNDPKRASSKHFDPDEYKFWIGDHYSKEVNYLILEMVGKYFPNSDIIDWQKKQNVKVPCRYFGAVDVAISEEKAADYNAFSTKAMDSGGNSYDIEHNVMKTSRPSDIIDKIIELDETYNYDEFAIETNSFQICIARSLEEVCDRRNLKDLSQKVVESKHYTEKIGRILGTIQPLMKLGRYHFRCLRDNDKIVPESQESIDQFDGIANLLHDDVIDSDEMAIAISEKPSKNYTVYGNKKFSTSSEQYQERCDHKWQIM